MSSRRGPGRPRGSRGPGRPRGSTSRGTQHVYGAPPTGSQRFIVTQVPRGNPIIQPTGSQGSTSGGPTNIPQGQSTATQGQPSVPRGRGQSNVSRGTSRGGPRGRPRGTRGTRGASNTPIGQSRT